MSWWKSFVSDPWKDVWRPVEKTFMPESANSALEQFQNKVIDPTVTAGAQYGPQVVGAALNFVPGVGPLLSAGWNTAMAGIQSYQNDGKINWGDVGKTAAISGAGAALSMGADKLASGAKAAQQGAQAGKNLVASGAAPATSNLLSVGGQALPQTASSIGQGAGSLVSGVPSTMSAFNAAGASASAAEASKFSSSVDASRDAMSKQAPTTTMDKVYNKAVGSQTSPAAVTSQLTSIGQQALANTLAPQGTSALSGFDSSQGMLTGTAAQPTGQDIFNAFGGLDYSPTAQFTQADLDKMRGDLMQNTGQQLSGVNDTFTPPSQYMATENTPKMKQTVDVMKGFDQGNIDLTNYVNEENLRRYNAAMGLPAPMPAMAGI